MSDDAADMRQLILTGVPLEGAIAQCFPGATGVCVWPDGKIEVSRLHNGVPVEETWRLVNKEQAVLKLEKRVEHR